MLFTKKACSRVIRSLKFDQDQTDLNIYSSSSSKFIDSSRTRTA